MLRCITIVLFIAFALVFTRANAFSQGTSSKELSIYSIDPTLIERGIDSIRNANRLSQTETRLVIDTNVPRLQDYIKVRAVANPKATIVIKKLSAVQYNDVCPNCEIIPNQSVAVTVYGTGVLSFDQAGMPSQQFNFIASQTYRQSQFNIMPVQVKTESPEPSFWESTAQPIIVGLGAVAIIALFFLIRS
ncbi:MAG TPA: hypothetical protein VFO76_08585 [Candidatus Kapabacteria bacterium]|nr:hypothetical protein [Candidatus Kapabacteria bacterium]